MEEGDLIDVDVNLSSVAMALSIDIALELP